MAYWLRALALLIGDSNSVLHGHSQPPGYNSSSRGPNTQARKSLMTDFYLPPQSWGHKHMSDFWCGPWRSTHVSKLARQTLHWWSISSALPLVFLVVVWLQQLSFSLTFPHLLSYWVPKYVGITINKLQIQNCSFWNNPHIKTNWTNNNYSKNWAPGNGTSQ